MTRGRGLLLNSIRALRSAVNSCPNMAGNRGLKLLRRPLLFVDLFAANNGWTARPVEAVSRRRSAQCTPLRGLPHSQTWPPGSAGGGCSNAMWVDNFKPAVNPTSVGGWADIRLRSAD